MVLQLNYETAMSYDFNGTSFEAILKKILFVVLLHLNLPYKIRRGLHLYAVIIGLTSNDWLGEKKEVFPVGLFGLKK